MVRWVKNRTLCGCSRCVCSPDQFFWLRPFASAGRARANRTSVKNLFHIGASIQPGPAIKRSQCRTAFGLESGLCHKSPGGFAHWMAVLAHSEGACEQAKPEYNDIPVNGRIDFENRESDMWGSKLLSGQSGTSRNAGIRVVGLMATQGLARCFAVA